MKQRHCKTCDRQTLAARPSINHLLHLFLSVFSLGAWLIVWVALSVRIGGWRCQSCGGKVGLVK